MFTHNSGAMYHRVLRKHVTFFKSFEDLDVVDCMENLRAEDHATDEDVDKVEAIHSSDSGSKKTTMKILYAKLTKLSDEGLRYFVENVLPDLETTEVIQCTFRYCPGPGKCPLKPGQGHKLSSETAAHNVKPVRDVIGYFFLVIECLSILSVVTIVLKMFTVEQSKYLFSFSSKHSFQSLLPDFPTS